MALNWLEEVVSQLYKLRGYIVLENEDFPMPEGVPGRAEADIIAFKDGKLVHVECAVWWGPGITGEQEAFDRLNSKFQRAQDSIFRRYGFLKRYGPITKIFVTSTTNANQQHGRPWDNLQRFCDENEIRLIEINTIVEDLIRELRKKYPKRKGVVGKEEGIARFLLHLIHNDFLKRPQE